MCKIHNGTGEGEDEGEARRMMEPWRRKRTLMGPDKATCDTANKPRARRGGEEASRGPTVRPQRANYGDAESFTERGPGDEEGRGGRGEARRQGRTVDG